MKEKLCLKIHKYQGAGNDFIIVDEEENKGKTIEPLKLSQILCDRHFSVGADTLLYISKSKIADIKMRVCEVDGSESNMCGNGLRCIGLYYMKKMSKSSVTVETLGGVKRVEAFEDRFIVSMGTMVPIGDFIVPKTIENIFTVRYDNINFYVVSPSEPHAVAVIENIDEVDPNFAVRLTKKFDLFPKGINVDFIKIFNDTIIARTFERGIWGETLACGTGAVSSAYVAREVFGYSKDVVKVQMRGGLLEVIFNDNEIFLKGPAEHIFFMRNRGKLVTEEKNLEFTARIIEKGEIEGNKYVILDKSFFYPDGKGGQIGDRGVIGEANIIEIKEKDHKIIHIIDKFPVNNCVLCLIDSIRRKDASVQHTAQHIISQAFISLFNIETVSFHMGESYSTIDLNCYDLSNEQVRDVENLSNKVIFENRIVKKFYVEEDNLAKINLRKKEEIEGPIRIVEIEGFDISMCGGTHVNFTGEIGLAKILKVEREKKNFIRLQFVAGVRALKEFQKKNEILKLLQAELTTGEEELLVKVKKMQEEIKCLSKEKSLLKNEFINQKAKILFYEEISKEGFLLKEFDDIDKNSLIELAKTLSNSYSFPFLIWHKDEILTLAMNLNIQPEKTDTIKQEIINKFNAKTWNISSSCIAIVLNEQHLEALKDIFLLKLS